MFKQQCVLCKGSRNLCGKGQCELLNSINNSFPKTIDRKRVKDIFGSSPPSVFVGRYGYPKVNMGPMLPREVVPAAWRLDSPENWYGKSIEEIITMRTELVRSRTKVNARRPMGNVVEVSKELAMSVRSVDTEVFLDKEIFLKPSLVVDPFSAPRGPTVTIKKAELTENPSVPRKVDYLVSDTDATTKDGVRELYKSNISAYHMQRILSAGLLGIKKRRRLVPTRWSITAMDDILGKQLMEKVRYMQELGELHYYSGNFAGNYFHILLIPNTWGFEMIETWLKGAFWASETASFQDHEGFKGRNSYASRITGAYYAARLSVVEHLLRMQRQASVVIYREITDEYYAPLGVWVIRETVKKALDSKPKVFSGVEKGISEIREKVRKSNWTEYSKLLPEIRSQTKLMDFSQ